MMKDNLTVEISTKNIPQFEVYNKQWLLKQNV